MERIFITCTVVGLALLLGGPVRAAPLSTNLVADPSFEHVNIADSGFYGEVKLLDWYDASGDGDDNYAYKYSTGYSGSNVPAGAGTYFYWGGFLCAYGDVLVYQNVDVSAGPTAVVIAGGTATYSLSAYFSGYNDQEYTAMQALFLDGGGTSLGTGPKIGGDAFCRSQPKGDGRDRNWARDVITGAVPVGTATVRLETVADSPGSTFYHDGYVDLVDFQIVPEPATACLLGLGLGAVLVRRRSGRVAAHR